MPETITSHTPGPWMAAANPSSIVGWPVVAQPMGRMICDVAIAPKPSDLSDGEWSRHFVEVAANARLIAAAPDLLEVLIATERQLRPLSGRSRHADLHKVICAAIARASKSESPNV